MKNNSSSAALSSYKGLLTKLKASKEPTSSRTSAVAQPASTARPTATRPTTTRPTTSVRTPISSATTPVTTPAPGTVSPLGAGAVGGQMNGSAIGGNFADAIGSPIGDPMPGIGGGVAPGQTAPGTVPPLGPGATGGSMAPIPTTTPIASPMGVNTAYRRSAPTTTYNPYRR